MQTIEVDNHISKNRRKEKVEAILVRLQFLKTRVSELRSKCETLKLESSVQKKLICSECGKVIDAGQEVVLKNSFGRIMAYYHRECFREIWRSQMWVFDYSQPGFLRIAGDDGGF
ncbi:MAG: hypothetical protein QXR63_04585 [Candidatus Bathyarchaeia archaeon]